MSTKQKFIEFRAKVADPKNYPRVPVEARELVLKNLDKLLLLAWDVDEQEFESRADGFVAGATRTLIDSYGEECNEMYADIPRVPSR